MTLLDAITRAEPDELYNLAATSFVPASWRQPVMTAQFTAVGVTSMLEAVRITKPGPARLPGVDLGDVRRDHRVAAARVDAVRARTTPTRWPSSTGTSWSRPTASATACTRARGILYNHESPRRPPEFVSRKVTRTAAAIKLGLADELHLGDLEATRDWSFAGDVAEAMWLMLQQEAGDDYVVCSGVSRTVRELVRRPSPWSTSTPTTHVVVDPEFVRPSDPVPLVGDPSKARAQARLGAADELRGPDRDDGRARPAGAQRGRRACGATSRSDRHRTHADLPTITVVTPSFNAGGHDRRDAAQRARAGLPARRARRRRRRLDRRHASTSSSAPRAVRYVSEPDRGLSHAMNKGVAHGRRLDRRLAQRRRRLPARRAARRRRGLRRAPRGRVGDRPLPDHRRRRAARSAAARRPTRTSSCAATRARCT